MDEQLHPAVATLPERPNTTNLAPAGKALALVGPLPQLGSPAALARKRFGNFVTAHFCYSVLCFFLGHFFLLSLFYLPPLPWPDWLLFALFGFLPPMALMGGYALLGYWFGGKWVWPLPLRGRDLARSVLAEAAVAWSWAALVIGLMAADSEGFLLMPVFFLSIHFSRPPLQRFCDKRRGYAASLWRVGRLDVHGLFGWAFAAALI